MRFVNELVFPLDYPLWWLLFSWLIWLLLKWRTWPRPTISFMLIYSISLGIAYIQAWQEYSACMRIELCAPYFSLLPFIAAVSFWFMVLSVPIALALKPKKLFYPKRYWLLSALVLSLAVWHLLSVESYSHIRPLVYLFRDLTYSDLISTNIYFYPVMGLLVPLLIWLLLGVLDWHRPALPTAIIYLISLASASTTLWMKAYDCRITSNLCEAYFSLPLFLGEIALWFLPLYTVMKLIFRVEIGNKLVALEKNRKDQLIGEP